MDDEDAAYILTKALKHYADEDQWMHTDDCSGGWWWSTQWVGEFDKENPWDIAAEALKEIEE